MKLSALALLSATSLAACSFLHPQPSVPDAYKGSVPVVLANHSGNTVCGFALVDPTGAKEAKDWMNKYVMDPNKELTFDVQPGKYHVLVTSCDNGLGGIVKNYTFDKPTYITYGGEGTAPPTYAMLKVGRGQMPVGGAAGGGGEDEAAPAEAAPTEAAPKDCEDDGKPVPRDPSNRFKCCSPMHHSDNGADICG